jgi:tetratricopeptide (TPR) repeat protein
MNDLLALALVLASLPAQPDRAAVATASQIETLTKDGKPDEAMEKGRAAVAAHPDDVDLRLALARALAAKARRLNRLVNVKMSQEDLDRGQVKVPDADLGAAPVRVDYDTGLFEEAVLHLDFGIKRAPQREDLRVFQCFLLTDAGRIGRAEAAIAGALNALPKTAVLAKTMAAYGAERAKRGDSAGGAALLAPVAEAFPKDASVLVDYGNVLTRLGRKSEAFAAIDRATQIAPRDVRYARTKAVSAMLLRDYRRAQSAFDAAFRLGRGIPDQFASYAAVYGIDPKASAELMRELGKPAPSSDPSVADLANAFARAGTDGASSGEAMTLARKLVASQQFVFAIPVLDRAIQGNPKNTEAKTMMGETYRALGCTPIAK